MSKFVIEEESQRKFYFQMPNIIDDLGLSVYAFRLYSHLKRVSGDQGACFQTIDTMAESCGMCRDKIIDAKKELSTPKEELGNKPLIIIEKREFCSSHRILIVDIWKSNIKKYSKKSMTSTTQSTTSTTVVDDIDSKNNPLIRPNLKNNCSVFSGEKEKKDDLFDQTKEIISPKGDKSIVTYSDFIHNALKFKKLWAINILDEAWLIFKSYTNPVSSWWDFITKIANNLQKKHKGERACQKKKSSIFKSKKSESSEPVTKTRVLPPFEKPPQELIERLMPGRKRPKECSYSSEIPGLGKPICAPA